MPLPHWEGRSAARGVEDETMHIADRGRPLVVSKYRDAAYAVLQEAGKSLTAAEILERASETGRITTKGDTPATTMGAMLYTDIARGRSRFAKDGPGLFKLSGVDAPLMGNDDQGGGTGAGEHTVPSTDKTLDDRDGQTMGAIKPGGGQDSEEIGKSGGKDHQRRIGAAGEFRVMSELLLRGYNADRITIDSGIDIRATKGKNVYEIQVKTVTEGKDGKTFVITIRPEAFERASGPNVYYIFVLRNRNNDIKYITISNKEMKNRIKDGSITKNKAGYQVRFALKDGSYFLGKKNVDELVNDWNL